MSSLFLSSPILIAQPASGFQMLVETLQAGGFVMVLIIACSITALSIGIITWLRLREHLLFPSGVISQLRSLPTYAAKGDIKPLQQFLAKEGSMLARMGAIAVSGHYTSKQECFDMCAARAKEEMHNLERDIPILEVMVTVAPLLGLLGTTAGLVGMFSAFGGEGGPDTAAIAQEIGVALRCTIAGLLVAVPSVLAHTIFVRKIDAIAMRAESLLTETIQSFYAHFEVHRTVSTPMKSVD